MALTTQLNSIRPLSMNLSSKASTRTRTAASAKNEEQRWAVMAARSKNGEEVFFEGDPAAWRNKRKANWWRWVLRGFWIFWGKKRCGGSSVHFCET